MLSLQVRCYLNMREGVEIPFEKHLKMKGGLVGAGTISGVLTFNNMPHYAQMIGKCRRRSEWWTGPQAMVCRSTNTWPISGVEPMCFTRYTSMLSLR